MRVNRDVDLFQSVVESFRGREDELFAFRVHGGTKKLSQRSSFSFGAWLRESEERGRYTRRGSKYDNLVALAGFFEARGSLVAERGDTNELSVEAQRGKIQPMRAC